MRDILEKISSQDTDVLEQSLAFVRERSAQEMERGKAAESRATAMLAILGILAGFLVPLVQSVSSISGEIKWSLIVMLLASLLFLVKGLYQAVRVLGVAKMYRLKVDTVYDFQPLQKPDALREEIAGLIWECKMAIQPNTEKLFRLHRCQRSGLIAIILFVLFGMLLLAAKENWISLPQSVAHILGIATLLLLLLADPIAEGTGIWRDGHRASS